MKCKKINKDVKFMTILTEDDIAVYSEGFVIYPDKVIPFGKIIIDAKYLYPCGGYYAFDDKYIYAYITKGVVYSIFDIENRCTIDDRCEFLKKREEVHTKKLSRKFI